MTLFKKASKLKLRFTTSKGLRPAEDLWDFTLEELNTIAKSYNAEIKAAEEEDFLNDAPAVDEVIKLKFEIVKEILTDKKAEKAAKKAEKAKAERKAKLTEEIAKREANLEDKTVDELEEELAALDAPEEATEVSTEE